MAKSSSPAAERDYLTITEAAQRLQVSPFQLRRWRKLKLGPACQVMGNIVRYDPKDLDEFERKCRIEAANL